MTSLPIETFDYQRIDIEGSRPLMAHTWKHLALVRFEQLHAEGGTRAIAHFLKKLQFTELWSGLQSSPRGYRHIVGTPAWPSIDHGAKGLHLIDQFFPKLLTMTDDDWDISRRERLVGIMKHTDAVPALAALEALTEHLTGKTLDGKPLPIPQTPYTGRN